MRSIPYALLGLVVLGSAVLPGARLMGEWESFTVYSVFGAQDSPLSLGIAPRANIGGQGYAILDASRRLLDLIGLPADLTTMRIPVILCGAIALVFFFIIAKRWFGPWPALGATALLAVNPIFSQYQHELIIAGPSIMALLIFLERLQALTLRADRIVNWVLLSLAAALVLLLYGPGRIIMAMVAVAWVATALVRPSILTPAVGRLALLARSAAVGVGTLIILVLIHPANLKQFGVTLFVPHNSESILGTTAAYPISQTLVKNARVLLEATVLNGGPYHSTYLEATLIQGRFPIVPLLVIPLFIAGLAISVASVLSWRSERSLARVAPLVLLAITTVPLLFSSVLLYDLPAPDGTGTVPMTDVTLSTYRIAFLLIPVYLLVGLTLHVLGRTRTPLPALTLAGTVALAALGAASLVSGRIAFNNLVDTADPRLTGPAAHAQWMDGYALEDRITTWGSSFQQHAQYLKWAYAVKAQGLVGQDGRTVTILDTRIACFPEAPLKTWSLGEIPQRNYHAVYLATYLNGVLAGPNVGYLFVPRAGDEPESLGEKTALYSGILGGSPSTGYEYTDSDIGAARIETLNGSSPNVLITTTASELQRAQELLNAEGVPFTVASTKDICWGNGK